MTKVTKVTKVTEVTEVTEVTDTAAPRAPVKGTAGQILDVAERLAQTRGFNGFSYADISTEMGITKASLHYHFRTKAELGRQLIARYSETFAVALEAIDASGVTAPQKLSRYARLYVPRRTVFASDVSLML